MTRSYKYKHHEVFNEIYLCDSHVEYKIIKFDLPLNITRFLFIFKYNKKIKNCLKKVKRFFSTKKNNILNKIRISPPPSDLQNRSDGLDQL